MTSPTREALIIADASPLVFLAKIGRLDLLPLIANRVWIPAQVWREVMVDSRPETSVLAEKNARMRG